MCLIFFALNRLHGYKLLLAANRDEYYSRPAERAHLWKEKIIGGRDLKAGGMWLGISVEGRFAAVTNFRNGINDGSKKSRGDIVKNFITGNLPDMKFLDNLNSEAGDYNGFNLICGNPGNLNFYSNITEQRFKITDGIHGLSNGTLDSDWPKVTKTVKRFGEVIKNGIPDFEEIFSMMHDETRADEYLLPDTGVSKDLERFLSPVFINMPSYGTRCTTILTVNAYDNLRFAERTYDEAGRRTGDVNLELRLDIKKPV